MIVKNFFDPPSAPRIFATLWLDGGGDFTLGLALWDLTPVDYADVDDATRKEIAAWVSERLEEYAAFERDQAQEMREEQARQRGGRFPFRGGVA